MTMSTVRFLAVGFIPGKTTGVVLIVRHWFQMLGIYAVTMKTATLLHVIYL